ncbi:MAG: metalloregulator ArsR/SmtB family transcription factor [Longimicrobiales bacterium]|nr:metalloregulator ArsR/SmtB family transcription factor [Longimicrobiales bacterium]
MTTSAPTTDARLLGIFQALADENRLRILEVLRDGEHCVCELQSSLALAQSLLSHHLRALREAGLVRDRREGRWVHYALIPEALLEVEEALASWRADAAAAVTTRAGGCAR